MFKIEFMWIASGRVNQQVNGDFLCITSRRTKIHV
jgi:hypothetical protein